jgi:hypothetical protein
MTYQEKINLDDLAKIEKERTIVEGDLLKSGADYKIDKSTGEKRLVPTDEQIQHIQETVEKILGENILSRENLNSGNLDITFEDNKDLIEYEFELENEQRIMVDPEKFPGNGWTEKMWQNTVVDTYDQSGRCRIRIKNGEPRLSIKVPLLSKDSDRSKCCIRLEFKPINDSQKKILLKTRDLITEEDGTTIHVKKGAPLQLNNGEKVWINRDEKGNHWIETDESTKIEDYLPEGITYLGHKRSMIKIKKTTAEAYEDNFDKFNIALIENFKVTSRTASGVADTTVSEKKESPIIKGRELAGQAGENFEIISEFIWKNKNKEMKSESDIEDLVKEIARIVNYGIAKETDGYRTWDVSYGRKVSFQKIEEEMKNFYRNLQVKIQEADNGELQPYALGRWIELEIDHNIHPFADGCGRIAKALSAFFFARYKKPLPMYSSRESYYGAMNKSESLFRNYYDRCIKK